MLELQDFTLAEPLYNYLSERTFADENFLLDVLERYKFISRNQLCEDLQRKGVIVQHVANVLPRVSTSEEVKYSSLEKELDIIIEQVNGQYFRVYASCTNKNNLTKVSMSIFADKVEEVRVTPYNLTQLQNKPANWDYDLLLGRIILDAVEQGASDIHFHVIHENKVPQYCLDYRLGLDLEPNELFKLDKANHSQAIVHFLSKYTKANASDIKTVEGVVTVAEDPLQDKDLSLRVTGSALIEGYELVCRIQRKSTVSLVINELGFGQEVLDDLHTLSNSTGGLILLTGGIRTGKNTTGFAIGNEMIKRPIKIADYSSPIETLMKFSQIDYGGDINTLVNLIRLAKKKDVNVVFINEIPNKEVAFAIVDLLNSGITVVTTTHLNRIWHLPYKLYEYLGNDYRNVLSQIRGCVNHRMFGVQCPHCSNEQLTDSLPPLFREFLSSHQISKVLINAGCPYCKNGLLRKKVKPYVEHLMISPLMVSDLLRMDAPFEMEQYLRDYVTNNKSSLEFTLAKAVAEGKLPYESLLSIL